jgi:type IV pilus assembly protein PilQ
MRRLFILCLAATWLLLPTPRAPESRPTEVSDAGATQPIALAKAAKKPSVSEVLVTPKPAGDVTIDVATTQPVKFQVSRFDHPDRLVVDVEGTTNSVPRQLIPVTSAIVKEVRVSQYRAEDPEVVRIVADLSGNPSFEARPADGGIRLEVKPSPRANSPVAAAAASAHETGVTGATTPETASSRGTSISAGATPAAALKKEATENRATEPAAPTHKKAAKPAVTPPPAAAHSTPAFFVNVSESPTLETAAKRDEPGPGYDTPIPASESRRDFAAAPRQTPQNPTPEALRADRAAHVLSAGNTFNPPVNPGAAPAAPAPAGEETPAYTGEQISLNLKDVDLKDFFRLVHEISGLNILVDPNVSGSVTMVLDNVPWDQALDIVLKDNGLGKVLEGNVLRIARLDTLMAEQETANKMAAARLEAAPLVTIFRPVNYATATDIATLFNTWSRGGGMGGGLSGSGAGNEHEPPRGPLTRRGTVLVDKRTNTLIISDVASQIPKIEETIAKLDTKTKQVAIEARIVLASSTFQRTLSAALVGSSSNTSGSTTGAAQTGTGSSITPPTPQTPTYTIPSNPATGFGVVAITNFSERYLIDAVISAAEIRSQAKTISRPSIITQNNAEGMVQQGVQIPVQTNINNTLAVQFANATLMLHVTPQVTDDGHIFLKIDVQNASPGSIITNSAVSINIQQATSQVVVPDGGTVVFGGVTVTQRQNSVTQIPLLGSIPLLGYLFKTTNVQDSDQELLFFVSPRILTTS